MAYGSFQARGGIGATTAPEAYGGSQARSQIGATAAGLHHSKAGSEPSLTYTTAHGNAVSLTH